MKIGILTFHWATNYGAILQSLALQRYLENLGHQVIIINYKPKCFDINFYSILKPINIKHPYLFYKQFIKEKKLQCFRNKYLNMSERLFTESQICELRDLDIVISGSDQVLNPYFTLYGEGVPTSTYFLNTINCSKKIGYALSFGCLEYPTNASRYAKQWLTNFDSLSVRENSGYRILTQLECRLPISLVPDPTLLVGKNFFNEYVKTYNISDYGYVYLLHQVKLPDSIYKIIGVKCKYCHNTESIETWLTNIANSKFVITNSYHGMIMAILFNRPFVVVQNTGPSVGMNDRFKTLLSILGLNERMTENNPQSIITLLNKPINWSNVKMRLSRFSKRGKEYIKNSINNESSLV